MLAKLFAKSNETKKEIIKEEPVGGSNQECQSEVLFDVDKYIPQEVTDEWFEVQPKKETPKSKSILREFHDGCNTYSIFESNRGKSIKIINGKSHTYICDLPKDINELELTLEKIHEIVNDYHHKIRNTRMLNKTSTKLKIKTPEVNDPVSESDSSNTDECDEEESTPIKKPILKELVIDDDNDNIDVTDVEVVVKVENEDEEDYFLKKWTELHKSGVIYNKTTDRIRTIRRYSVRMTAYRVCNVNYTNDLWSNYFGEMDLDNFNGVGKLTNDNGDYLLGKFENNYFQKGEAKIGKFIFIGEFTGGVKHPTMTNIISIFTTEEQSITFEGIPGKMIKKKDEYALITLPGMTIDCKIRLTYNGVEISYINKIEFSNGCSVTNIKKFATPISFTNNIVLTELNGTFNFPNEFKASMFNVMLYKYFLLTTFPFFSTKFFSNYSEYPLTSDMILNTMTDEDWIDLGLNKFQLKILKKKTVELAENGIIS